MPDGVKGSTQAVAETIANNVRSKIIKEHLKDPTYYDKMSVLLDEVLSELKAKRLDYEEYLKKIAELAKQVQAGHAEDLPVQLNTSGRRALYNNLEQNEALAIQLDDLIKSVRPDGWRGVQAREQIIKGALYDVLQSEDEVERIFVIMKEHTEY
jgi:type I restriction enzyme R subunit